MFHHIVLWRVNEDAGAHKQLAHEMKEMLEALPAQIPEIVEFRVGINEILSARSFDVSLVSSFKSKKDLKTYQAHPAHQPVVERFKVITKQGAVVDYED